MLNFNGDLIESADFSFLENDVYESPVSCSYFLLISSFIISFSLCFFDTVFIIGGFYKEFIAGRPINSLFCRHYFHSFTSCFFLAFKLIVVTFYDVEFKILFAI